MFNAFKEALLREIEADILKGICDNRICDNRHNHRPMPDGAGADFQIIKFGGIWSTLSTGS